MADILERIRSEVRAADRPENRINYQRFFKERLREPIGLKTPVLRRISNRVFREAKNLDKEEVLTICDDLLESGTRYGRFFAFDWASKLDKKLDESDFSRLEAWLKRYVNNWGACDHLSDVLGRLIARYPGLSEKRMEWTKSDNRWLRRAAAVSLIGPVQQGQLLDEVLRTATALLNGPEDLVQKGYGWMLKEAGTHHSDRVAEFVMARKEEMPRTALRYAIEKWSPERRALALRKSTR